jgi:hypothetical protein
MNTVRIGVTALCVAASAAGYLWLRGPATDDVRAVQVNRVQAEQMPMRYQSEHRYLKSAADAQLPDGTSGPAFEPHAPELLPPTQSLQQVQDAVNADIGPEGEYIDPAALAEVLRSDPELARLLKE